MSSKGSIIELRRLMGGPSEGYNRARALVRGKDWSIAAFTGTWITVRVERENIELDRYKGTIRQRFKL